MGDENPRAQEALQVGVSEPPGPWAASSHVSLGLAMTQLLLHGCVFFFFFFQFTSGGATQGSIIRSQERAALVTLCAVMGSRTVS